MGADFSVNGDGKGAQCRVLQAGNIKLARNGLLLFLEQIYHPMIYSLQICSPLPWMVTDGNAGNRRQATALAAALGFAPRDVVLQTRAPWRWLAPRRVMGSTRSFGAQFATELDKPPHLAIGCGRQAALATRLLRERGTKVVQILHPRIHPSHWDLVIAPEHDGLHGSNVLTLLGSLNPVDDAWLAAARTRFLHLSELPQPRTALLLGGDSKHWRFDLATFQRLATQLQTALTRDGGSLLATTSRRTPPQIVAALKTRFEKFPGLIWCGERDGENPYPGLLACAERIICTPDSVNMISEACATHAPVFVFDAQHISGRPRHFIETLLQHGRIRNFDSSLAPFNAQPLRETARVAAMVRQRLGL
jgi:mitochondrial fission protein ELM1